MKLKSNIATFATFALKLVYKGVTAYKPNVHDWELIPKCPWVLQILEPEYPGKSVKYRNSTVD